VTSGAILEAGLATRGIAIGAGSGHQQQRQAQGCGRV
jgi:hypothetical protein